MNTSSKPDEISSAKLADRLSSLESKVHNVDENTSDAGSSQKEKRKSKRLEILQNTLVCLLVGFIVSVAISVGLVEAGKPTPTELIVLNTILGSTLTTIVGVIAGTSID